MNKYIFFLISAFVFHNAFSSLSYRLEDLDKFEATNFCSKCDLSSALLGEKHGGSILSDSFLIETKIRFSEFNDSDLSSSIFIRGGIIHTVFNNSVFDNANLSYLSAHSSSFHGASFKKCNLNNADFDGSNFSNADFTEASFKNIKLNNAILIGAQITKEQLSQAQNLECAVLPDGTVHDPSDRCESV